MRNRLFQRFVLVLAALAVVSGEAWAHHSFAMFDRNKEVVLEGSVREFQWTNPHSWIQLTVAGVGDTAGEWAIEMQAPSGLLRRGWKYNTLKAGDKVKVTISPMKNGTKGGILKSVTLPDGTTIEG